MWRHLVHQIATTALLLPPVSGPGEILTGQSVHCARACTVIRKRNRQSACAIVNRQQILPEKTTLMQHWMMSQTRSCLMLQFQQFPDDSKWYFVTVFSLVNMKSVIGILLPRLSCVALSNYYCIHFLTVRLPQLLFDQKIDNFQSFMACTNEFGISFHHLAYVHSLRQKFCGAPSCIKSR